MAILTVEELHAQIKPGKPLAGLDLGTKTIGVAVSDIGWRLANPKAVVQRTKFTRDAQSLLLKLSQFEVCAVFIGLPANMDGSEGPRAQATRAFVRNMEKLTGLPFIFQDERLSTVAAERALLEMDVSRAKRAERIDAAAAAFILQGALDRLAILSSAAEAG
jgi:putative holliday junction resolvase